MYIDLVYSMQRQFSAYIYTVPVPPSIFHWKFVFICTVLSCLSVDTRYTIKHLSTQLCKGQILADAGELKGVGPSRTLALAGSSLIFR